MIRVVTILLLASCAPTWNNAARVTEGAAIGMLACDGMQTQQWLAHTADTGLVERNPILGDAPAVEEVWTYLGVIAFGVVVANRELPAWARVAINSTVMAAETHAIYYNHYYGASLACGLGGYDQQTAETHVYDSTH